MATAISLSPNPAAWRAAGKPVEERQPRHDPADYAGILEKHDDRLIRDIGLSRDDIVSPQDGFWNEWEKAKSVWQL